MANFVGWCRFREGDPRAWSLTAATQKTLTVHAAESQIREVRPGIMPIPHTRLEVCLRSVRNGPIRTPRPPEAVAHPKDKRASHAAQRSIGALEVDLLAKRSTKGPDRGRYQRACAFWN